MSRPTRTYVCTFDLSGSFVFETNLHDPHCEAERRLDDAVAYLDAQESGSSLRVEEVFID